MKEQASQRLVDQRMRNHMIRTLEMLVEWEDTLLKQVGLNEYFNIFFDFFPARPPLWPNSTITEQERQALTTVLVLMNRACEATPSHMEETDFIASGWPQKMESVAREALQVMMIRGRFSDEEEQEQSLADERS